MSNSNPNNGYEAYISGSAGTGTTSAGTGSGARPTPTSAWAGTEPIDSYEQFLRNKAAGYGTIYNETVAYYDKQNADTLAAIEARRKAGLELAGQVKTDAYENAEIERERGVVDARSSYAQNLASYGAKAERIGDMGLTGSGYSAYLDSKAYAQQRAETQAANAEATTVKREADSTYSKNVLEIEDQAAADTLNANQAAEEGKTNALLSYQEQLLENDAAIGEYRNTQEANAEEEGKVKDDNLKDVTTQSNLDPSAFTQGDIDNMATNGTLTPEGAEQAKANQNRAVYNGVVDSLNAGNIETIKGAFNDVEKLYRDGNIDQSTYNEIKNLLGNTVQGINYQYESGSITAQQYLDQTWALGDKYHSGKDVEGGWHVSADAKVSAGEDITLNIGSTSSGAGFTLEVGEKITNDGHVQALNKLATGDPNKTPSVGKGGFSSNNNDGSLVYYEGSLFIYSNSGWRRLTNPDGSEPYEARAAFVKAMKSTGIQSKKA